MTNHTTTERRHHARSHSSAPLQVSGWPCPPCREAATALVSTVRRVARSVGGPLYAVEHPNGPEGVTMRRFVTTLTGLALAVALLAALRTTVEAGETGQAHIGVVLHR